MLGHWGSRVRRAPRRRRRGPLAVLSLALLVGAAGCGGFASGGEETVRVYSGRHYDLEPAFEEFSQETGISVEFLYGGDAELRERLQAEGEDTQADVYMTVDAANLALAAEEGLFQPIQSQELTEAVPASLRDPRNRWFGLSMRARTLVYNPDHVDRGELSTYEALTSPQWRDRVCMRNSNNSYTQSMVASLIAHHGYDGALEIVSGWVDNGVEIMSNDVRIIDTVAEDGGCDVGLVNHYYLARMMEDRPDIDAELMWANQDGRGTHVNVSGAGVTRHADNPELATRLLEWLATDGQAAFNHGNHEIPVNPDVEPDQTVQQWGDFQRDELNAQRFGELNDEAVRLMNEAGYE